MKLTYSSYILVFFLIISCSNTSTLDIDENIEDTIYQWAVPLNDIVGSFNPFPFAENPIMSSVNSIEGLNDESTVVVVSFKEIVNIYPLSFVHPFETVNDTLSNTNFTISYCPITQSTINIDRTHKNNKLTFRASGILYKENLVMYDSNSDSFWSQMLIKSIKGPFEGETLNVLPMIETTWGIAKTYFPDANVFSNKSITSSKVTTIQKSTNNIPNNEKVFGLIDNINNINSKVFIYQYSQFQNGIQLYNSGFTTRKIVIGSQDLKFIIAFLNETNSTFQPVQNEFPIVMIDNLGNNWNAFGIAVSGPNKGDKLQTANAFVASWWAWEDFYSNFSLLE